MPLETPLHIDTDQTTLSLGALDEQIENIVPQKSSKNKPSTKTKP